MRKPVIAGNWKMHKTHLEAISLVQTLSYDLGEDDYERVEVVVCPPFTALRSVQTVIEGDHMPIALGAQNLHWEPEGAYTGEVSATMLKELHCTYVIIGHSERRQYFGETDETVNLRVKAAVSAELTPILCVGETLLERDAGSTNDVLARQVREGLKGVSKQDVSRAVIAYEPVWAIGTGRAASAEDANGACAHIRSVLADLGDAEAVRIQYGGSVSEGNIATFMSQADIDGALVGGASIDPRRFAMILKFE